MSLFANAGLGLALLGGFCAAPVARADTPFQFLTGNTDRAGTAWITTNGSQLTPTYENVYAGQYQIQLGSGSTARTLYTYCVDVQHDIFEGDQTTATLKDFTAPASGFATADYNHASPTHTKQQNAEAVAYLLDTYLNHTISTAKSVDVGLSIWDIVNDGGDGLTQGDLRALVSAPILTDVSGLIQEAYTHQAQAATIWVSNPKLNTPGNTRYQDYGLHATDYPIPEASTRLSLGALLGMGIVAGFRQRRRIQSFLPVQDGGEVVRIHSLPRESCPSSAPTGCRQERLL